MYSALWWVACLTKCLEGMLICIQLDIKSNWLCLVYGLVCPILVVVETNEEHDEEDVKEGFLLARVKFDRDGDGVKEALGMGSCCINTWDGSELELAWSKKSCSYFENNFSILLLSSISNTSIFKVCYVLNWLNFLVIKTFSNVFCSIFCWGR